MFKCLSFLRDLNVLSTSVLNVLSVSSWLIVLRHLDTRAFDYLGLSGTSTLSALHNLALLPFKHLRHLREPHLEDLPTSINVLTALSLIRNIVENTSPMPFLNLMVLSKVLSYKLCSKKIILYPDKSHI